MDEAIKVRREVNDDIVTHIRNTLGTGVGTKIDKDGNEVQAIHVFVTKKEDPNVIRAQDASQLIPQSIQNIPVEVIEVGDLKPQQYMTCVRPIIPGYSVSHPKVTAGTIGGIFTDKDGDVVILSNNHVLANENNAVIGDLIFQPGTLDNPGASRQFAGWGGVPDIPYIGNLKAFVPLSATTKNTQDSAIATIDRNYLRLNMVSPKYPNGATANGFGETTPGMDVQKFGRTSGMTKSKVISTHVELSLGYPFGTATFQDLILTKTMSAGGDSGSLLFDTNMNILGLLFAGSNQVTLFNNIKLIRYQYGLTPWRGLEHPADTYIPHSGYVWTKNLAPGANIEIDQTTSNFIVCANCNQHAYVETDVPPGFRQISVDINNISDAGATWGPGIVLVYPKITLKINVRGAAELGSAVNGVESIYKSPVNPTGWHTMRFTRTNSAIIGEIGVKDSSQFTTILSIPLTAVGGSPVRLRVGKTDQFGSKANYATPGTLSLSNITNVSITK